MDEEAHKEDNTVEEEDSELMRTAVVIVRFCR